VEEVCTERTILIATSLAVIDRKGEEAPKVHAVAVSLWQDEESLSSSLASAVEKLSSEVQQLKQTASHSATVWTSMSAIRSKHFFAQERG